MTLEFVTRIGTLISFATGIWGIILGVIIYRRQSNALIFLKYTERYEKVMESFPPNTFSARLNSDGEMPEESDELTIAALKYLNLCSEEFYLYRRKYLSKDIWQIWESELKRTIRSPLYCREWSTLKKEFEAYPEFLGYVDEIQRSCGSIAKDLGTWKRV
jgi:hypothetical protein